MSENDEYREAMLGLLTAYDVAAINAVQQVRHRVRIAREAGASWTDVANALGITKQAAWERYAELEKDNAI